MMVQTKGWFMGDSAQGLHARLLDMPETLSDDLLEQMEEIGIHKSTYNKRFRQLG